MVLRSLGGRGYLDPPRSRLVLGPRIAVGRIVLAVHVELLPVTADDLDLEIARGQGDLVEEPLAVPESHQRAVDLGLPHGVEVVGLLELGPGSDDVVEDDDHRVLPAVHALEPEEVPVELPELPLRIRGSSVAAGIGVSPALLVPADASEPVAIVPVDGLVGVGRPRMLDLVLVEPALAAVVREDLVVLLEPLLGIEDREDRKSVV